MVKEIPEDVKAVLGQLTGPQQVTLRKYIATLRAEAKDLENELLALKDTDPNNAHFHGGERCTSSHGHDKGHHGADEGHNHGHEHAHKDEAPSHDHEHAHKEPKDHKGGHSHDSSHSHGQAEEHSHEHAHKEHKQNEEGHSHEKAEHHDHSHGHSSDKMDEDIPAWKKRAMESGNNDPMAAPFGGNWNTESSLSASDDKMKE